MPQFRTLSTKARHALVLPAADVYCLIKLLYGGESILFDQVALFVGARAACDAHVEGTAEVR